MLSIEDRRALTRAAKGQRTKGWNGYRNPAVRRATEDLLAEFARPIAEKYFPLDSRGRPIPFYPAKAAR